MSACNVVADSSKVRPWKNGKIAVYIAFFLSSYLRERERKRKVLIKGLCLYVNVLSSRVMIQYIFTR